MRPDRSALLELGGGDEVWEGGEGGGAAASGWVSVEAGSGGEGWPVGSEGADEAARSDGGIGVDEPDGCFSIGAVRSEVSRDEGSWKSGLRASADDGSSCACCDGFG